MLNGDSGARSGVGNGWASRPRNKLEQVFAQPQKKMYVFDDILALRAIRLQEPRYVRIAENQATGDA